MLTLLVMVRYPLTLHEDNPQMCYCIVNNPEMLLITDCKILYVSYDCNFLESLGRDSLSVLRSADLF